MAIGEPNSGKCHLPELVVSQSRGCNWGCVRITGSSKAQMPPLTAPSLALLAGGYLRKWGRCLTRDKGGLVYLTYLLILTQPHLIGSLSLLPVFQPHQPLLSLKHIKLIPTRPVPGCCALVFCLPSPLFIFRFQLKYSFLRDVFPDHLPHKPYVHHPVFFLFLAFFKVSNSLIY